ncbi:MAG: tetratricopeptide repeat protein [Treponema sp.]|jgi:putative GTP pyrophosphokinase|nr:tetratricopeptide repeat protein [Treponema sp.]
MALSQKALQEEYKKYEHIRVRITRDLESQLEKTFSHLGSRILVKGRVKDFASYYKKYIRILKDRPGGDRSGEELPAGVSPEQPPAITDLIGLRVVCPFLEDTKEVEKIITGNYEVVETDRKGSGYSFKEFGYESTHFLVTIPPGIIEERGPCGCDVAELQVRTILQDAWAEVEHELVYKAEFTPFDEPLKRKLAALNASLSLADTIFQEIRGYQRQLNGELGKRRDSFYRQIAESTDALLLPDGIDAAENAEHRPLPPSGNTVDDMLLNALYAHNSGRFVEAIGFYSRILDMKIAGFIRSLIHKHRGMAYFAQSMYQEAIDDFSGSLEWDKKSYKAAYYRGVVWTVLRRYSQAVDDFSLSLDINPYQAFCLFRRGQAYYHIGDYPAALADCDASLDLEPENQGARKLREIVQGKLQM